MDTPNHTVDIRLTAFVAVLIIRQQAVKPLQSVSICCGELPSNYKGPIRISNDEKIQNQVITYLITLALKILMYKYPHSECLPNTSFRVNSYLRPSYFQISIFTQIIRYLQGEGSSAPDVNKIMSSFIGEFKQLINPLITLLTKITSKLVD